MNCRVQQHEVHSSLGAVTVPCVGRPRRATSLSSIKAELTGVDCHRAVPHPHVWQFFALSLAADHMWHSSEAWQAGDDNRAALSSPRALLHSPLSPLQISPLSPPYSPISRPLVTASTASWLYEGHSPSSTLIDYRSAASSSPSSSFDSHCHLVDNGSGQSFRCAVPHIASVPSVLDPPSPFLLTPSSYSLLPPPTADSAAHIAVDARVERRKLKHKQLDYERRRRENMALQSLARLTAAPNTGGSAAIQFSPTAGSARRGRWYCTDSAR